MAEEHHHHLFHHKKEDDVDISSYGEQTTVDYGREDEYEKAKREERHHKNKEHEGELGAAATGAFALVYFL